MFRINRLFSLVLTVVIILLMVMSTVSCGGGRTMGTPSGESEKTTESAVPRGGATFTGQIEIRDKASSGTIQFSISADGSSITSVTVNLKDLKCNGFSAGSMNKEVSGSFLITDGNINASPSGIGEIKGRFTSSTKASGTIDITLEIPFSAPCELGEWPWSANAD